MTRRKSRLTIVAVVAAFALAVICLAIVILGVYGYIRLESRINAIENQMQQSSSSELQAAIDFFKDQTQVLIWILGVIITGAGAILAFFGITTRKQVEEKYEQKYSELIAAKDTEVFKKKIVILYQDNDDTLMTFRDEIRDRGYNSKVIRVCAKDIISKLIGYSIVIYRVQDENDPLYHMIADWCEKEQVHCILYCPGIYFSKGNVFSSKQWLYVSISQYITKLRESLYTLLYLTP